MNEKVTNYESFYRQIQWICWDLNQNVYFSVHTFYPMLYASENILSNSQNIKVHVMVIQSMSNNQVQRNLMPTSAKIVSILWRYLPKCFVEFCPQSIIFHHSWLEIWDFSDITDAHWPHPTVDIKPDQRRCRNNCTML